MITSMRLRVVEERTARGAKSTRSKAAIEGDIRLVISLSMHSSPPPPPLLPFSPWQRTLLTNSDGKKARILSNCEGGTGREDGETCKTDVQNCAGASSWTYLLAPDWEQGGGADDEGIVSAIILSGTPVQTSLRLDEVTVEHPENIRRWGETQEAELLVTRMGSFKGQSYRRSHLIGRFSLNPYRRQGSRPGSPCQAQYCAHHGSKRFHNVGERTV